MSKHERNESQGLGREMDRDAFLCHLQMRARVAGRAGEREKG